MKQSHCYHFSALPMGMRVLFTSTLIVLGTGYLFAMIYIFESHAGRDGNPNLSVNDLMIAYSGSKADTRLESALKGPMAGMLPSEERAEIIAWVRRGGSQADYDGKISKLFDQRCMACHNGSNPHIPNLKGYENIQHVVARDTGMDIFTLVRVSHIHLFGITFIFFLVGSIFCHAYVKPIWLKCVLIGLPFVSILFDIGSWYLTKVFPPFAYVVMISGVIMGICFAAMWLISIYQMWFYTPPSELIEHDGVVS
ncbi:MAG: hypothetical protein OEW08_04710 [Gammaproteobacteria bacterium]|nr:hypothetical protein [Gammaproteobacteria bacterium]